MSSSDGVTVPSELNVLCRQLSSSVLSYSALYSKARACIVKRLAASSHATGHEVKVLGEAELLEVRADIIAHYTDFHTLLHKTFPHNPGFADMFTGDDKRATREAFAFRNGSLQGAYLIMAARAIGLDCGPMSGFNNALVDQTFFDGGSVKSNFLCALGHGDPAKVMARLPRLGFDEVCQLL